MNFLEIPEEVIEGHLLPFLKWNDLLRFRRVCKVTKAITDGYLAVNPGLAPEIEINEEDQSFGAFLDMGIPTTKIYVKNLSGNLFYEKDEENMGEFLERYGGIVTSLRVHQLPLKMCERELHFLTALTNLQALEIGHFVYAVTSDCRRLSDVIRGLKVLKIGQEENTWRGIGKEVDLLGIQLAQGNAPSLEYFSLPFTSHTEDWDSSVPRDSRDPQYSLKNTFKLITTCVQGLNRATKDNWSKIVDFGNFHDPAIPREVRWHGSTVFGDLSKACLDNGVLMRNVSALWSVACVHPQFPSLEDFPIVSLVGLHPYIVMREMPFLERIEVRATSGCCVGQKSIWKENRPLWNRLKQLDITVDSKSILYHLPRHGDCIQSFAKEDTKRLFQFFFQNDKYTRPGLTELRLKFTKNENLPLNCVAIPRAGEIVHSCPNLKKLILVNWPGTNKAILELFKGLRGLEEVTLERCKNLGNVAFVGVDTSRPVFLKLRKLRKLTLKGLDKMPKISDLLVTMVIQHLKLTHLTLTTDSPIKSVTVKGIRALLDGEFSQSIEKFPFQDWSFDGVSVEEFTQLERQFRSYNML